MPSIMPNGAKYAVSTSLAAAVAITALSNANPAVASAGTLPLADAIVTLVSGWSELNGAVARVGASGGGTFELEGIDTSDTVRYPAGEGIGAYQVASGFVNIGKIRSVEMAGGEQQFYQYQYVDDASGRQLQAPTFKSAQTLTLQVDYDPSLPHFNALVELDRKRLPVVLRETLPNGDVIYYVGWISFTKVPTKVLNEFMANQLTFSLTSEPIRYAAGS